MATDLPRVFLSLALTCVPALAQVTPQTGIPASGATRSEVYFPPAAGQWQHRKPSELGMDDGAIAAAIVWAQTQETDWPKDFSKQEETFGKPLGPLPTTRASTNGVIIKNGYIIAEFGETTAVDPTYSVAKSYLSTILGLAIDRGMIKSITDPVADSIHDGGYDPALSPHNHKVTWQNHATQTSEWQGDMFGKSDTFLGVEQYGKGAMKPREIREPGTYFEYNDVRINRFSLSLLRVWKRPLPDVLKTEIMDPIGASSTWKWVPYDNATVQIEDPAGKVVPMPSVSGGTRWGGGLWISTLDHARFGLLVCRKGNWDGKQIVSKEWLRAATRPHPELAGAKPDYGYLWWLNTEGAWPAAPKSSFAAIGAGSNTIWIDPEHDLVVVWRWHKGGDTQAEFYKKILGAIVPPK